MDGEVEREKEMRSTWMMLVIASLGNEFGDGLRMGGTKNLKVNMMLMISNLFMFTFVN